jgi:large conductance mechanosensitive channel
MLREFKAFVMRGNVMDLAVAVIIGGAFGKIVSSLVNDILMPLIGLIIGGVDFSGLAFTLGSAKVTYGNFINNIIDFIIIALVIFLMIKFIDNLKKKPALLHHHLHQSNALPQLHVGIVNAAESDISRCRTPD